MSYHTYFKEIPDDLSVEEKARLIKENANVAIRLRNEINAFKISSTAPIEYELEETLTPTPTSISEFHQVEIHIQKAYHSLSLLSITGLSEETISIKIKSIVDANKLSALEIDKIKLLLYQDYLLYSKMYLESQPTEQHEIENQIASLMAKIYILDDLLEEEDLSEEEIAECEKETSNNLFFLLTESGNNPILESIRKKKIPAASFSRVRGLILDIKRGHIRNAKKLTDRKIYNLRDGDIRLLFDNLGKGNYVILDIILKTVQNTKHYKDNVDLKRNQFLREKQFYMASVDDEEFRKKHESYLIELLAILENKDLSEDDENARRNM